MTEAAAVDLRCSAQARLGEVRPVGTAVSVEAFALLELPLPWPSKIEEHPALAGVADVLEPLGARVQALAPSSGAVSSGAYRATLYVRPAGAFRSYRRLERHGPLASLPETCAALAAEAGAGAGGADGERGELAEPLRDLLVCTHGARDRCCGSMGTAMFAGIDLRPDVRLGRTSHLGGHRFAPTALLLPEGTAWAWLDDSTVAAVLDRSVPVGAVLDRYRGSTAMGDPVLQAAEAAAFAATGWSWLHEERTGTVVERGDGRWTVRIDSTAGSWLAAVVSHGELAQPVCGSDEASPKTDPQLEVVSLERTTGA